MTIANMRMVQTIGKRNYYRNVAYMLDVITQRIFEAAEEWKIGCPGARAGSRPCKNTPRTTLTMRSRHLFRRLEEAASFELMVSRSCALSSAS